MRPTSLHCCLPILLIALGTARAQDPAASPPESPQQPGQTQDPPDKRVFGVLPNYRTANETAVYTPISAKQKFIIGAKDSFDYPLLLLAGTFAGLGQLTNENPSFGQGLAGYGRRLGTAYADQAIGNMMTEAIYSSLLHEDPRYFRRGHGSIGSRTWYALTRVMVTRTDSGGRRFNFSEWVGNATGVAISNSYYPDNRNAGAGVAKLCEQVGTDAISQVLKEFWPDIKGKLFHHKDTGSLKSREKFIPIAEFAGDSACPTLAHKGWLSSGAGVSACQPNFPQLLTVAAR